MRIQELRPRGLLSFGQDFESLEMLDLNVLIGPNGAGKSNLLEAIAILRAAPKNLATPVKEAGGVHHWIWKGKGNTTATIEAVFDNPEREDMPFRHSVSFVEHGMRFEVTEERIENCKPFPGFASPYSYYKMERGHPTLYEKASGAVERNLDRSRINPEESILSQIKDPERYPMLNHLAEFYGGIQLFREWSFGRYTPPRLPQEPAQEGPHLSETCKNLALVLNSMRTGGKRELLSALNALYPEIEDFNVQFEGGAVQLYLEERGFSIPATRLSDGTLRYLCLLAILCHPAPPPLVCIEEPELGLHPDVLTTLAELLCKASERCQLIVTTHSDILIDALSHTPESVIVCEKKEGKTQMQRLSKSDLEKWLSKYRLGELWIKGELGGTRW